MYPTIVVAAYKRPHSLMRLLSALANAAYPDKNIRLIISIDYSETRAVYEAAEDFVWDYGEKLVIAHAAHLGLKAHILACGALSETYEAVIVLEDDLLVSKHYYTYACEALNFYLSDEAIAGISLYHYAVSENGFFPFYPIDDGSDVYFMQVASSWGQMWTAQQWRLFAAWFSANPSLVQNEVVIPGYLQSWSNSSWKKHFIHYLIATQRYFVFPRYALSTNFADAGTNASTKALYQVPIQQLGKKYLFKKLANTYARYDAYFELEASALQALVVGLQHYDFTNDLYGTKCLQHVKTPYILSTRKSSNYLASYGLKMLPNIANVLYNVAGKDIFLSATQNVDSANTPLYKHYYPIQSIAGSVFESLQTQATVSIISCVSVLDAMSLRSLQSVSVQDYPNIEHIIIDPTGCTLHEKSLKNKSHIRLIRPEGGLVVGLLEALNTCKGQIVSILPSSAHYLPDAVAKAVKIFSTFKKISCFTSLAHAQHIQAPQQMRYAKGSTKAAPAIATLFWRTYLHKTITLPENASEAAVMQHVSRYLLKQTNMYTFVEQTVQTSTVPDKYPLWKNWLRSIEQNNYDKYRWLKTIISLCSYPFYHYNIPIAQYPYLDINAYPPLIKYNQAEACFYLSAY